MAFDFKQKSRMGGLFGLGLCVLVFTLWVSTAADAQIVRRPPPRPIDLHRALRLKLPALVVEYLNRGGNVNEPMRKGEAPLIFAVKAWRRILKKLHGYLSNTARI